MATTSHCPPASTRLYFEQYLADPSSELYSAFLPVWPDEFVADVQNDTLPQISYLLPPIVQSEHPSASPTARCSCRR
ncbi:MAG: alkaline phosphatase family protein [Acidimicrobiia bacterium]